jgi:hypothetical protein
LEQLHQSGCHANANAAASRSRLRGGEIQLLADLLWVDIDNDAIDATDGGFTKIKLNNPDFSTSDSVISAANGTEFNVKTCARALQPSRRFEGTHNKFLVSPSSQSATYLRTLYNYLPAPPGGSRGREIRRPPE